MARDNYILVILPVLGVIILSVCVYLNSPNPTSFRSIKALQMDAYDQVSKSVNYIKNTMTSGDNINQFITNTDSTCSDCPSGTLETQCSDTSYPVLGGLDFVQYFTEFKNDDGTYDETSIGEVGSSDYSSVYDGFTFYFKSSANKELFDASPTSYTTQYGGFCSWGVSGETCPEYAWSATCMGPSGNWGHWTIQSDKLYFFFKAEAKDKFMAAVSENVEFGDSRWSSWYSSSHFDTACYAAIVSD